MKIHNPTNKKLSIQHKGETYSVEAQSSVVVPSDVATFWKEQIHNFIEVSPESISLPSKIAETPVEVKIESKDEVPVKVVETKKKVNFKK